MPAFRHIIAVVLPSSPGFGRCSPLPKGHANEMKHTAPRFLWIVAACLALLPGALAWSPAPGSASKPDSSKPIAPAPPAARTKDWPREFKEDGSTLVLYQPQIESWENQTKPGRHVTPWRLLRRCQWKRGIARNSQAERVWICSVSGRHGKVKELQQR